MPATGPSCAGFDLTNMNGNRIVYNTPPVTTSDVVLASGAVTSPFWLPWLQTFSETAATLAPILGLIWMTVQIITTLVKTFRKRSSTTNGVTSEDR